jgi:ABC-type nitrate/sulfonate/bicarbonate transport system permease component
VVQIGFLVALLALWFFATEFGGVSRFLLPSPVSVADSLVQMIADGTIAGELAVTLYEVFSAFGLSAVVGLGIGFFVARSAYLVEVFTPVFSALFAVPVILLLPLFVLLLGLGPESKIAAGIASCFFPIVLSAIVGFGKIDRIYMLAARSMGASHWQLFARIMMPAALPAILSGLRLGFVISFLSVLGAETIAARSGLGRAIVEASENLRIDKMFALIVVVVFLAFLLNLLVSYVERRGRWE